MAKKLLEFEDRNESHKALEKALAKNPKAECREEIENGNGKTLYQVWDGSDEALDVARRPAPKPGELAPEVQRATALSDDDVSRIADAILAKTKAK